VSPKRSTSVHTPTPALTSIHPSAARWIGALIRMTSPHPAMGQLLEVIERLQDAPFRTNFVLLGEPGTGKGGLARALHHLCAPGAPLVRLDVAGFPDEEALAALCGRGRSAGAAERADGGAILIEETAGLGPRTQAALLRLLKSGKCERLGAPAGAGAGAGSGAGSNERRRRVNVIAMSDHDLRQEVTAGRLRHDLFYTLARVVLWLPPLRERIEDIGPATVWMGNRILRAAGLPLELMPAAEFDGASAAERAQAVRLGADAIRELEGHPWTGNFRELETVLERALMLHRNGPAIGAAEIRAALSGGPQDAPALFPVAS
jgi:DNA-binding NtrC family response regulator